MIKTNDLVKVFRTDEVETTALNKVNITVEKGEFVAIMGPSGCGKSTLLNILGLLDTPSGGDYYFNGEEVARYKEKQRTNLRKGNIGFVFQEHLLLPHLTVRENILLPLLASKHDHEELLQKEKRAEELMVKTGISDLSSRYPSAISGGEAQRAALVRALVNTPSILLADEPTGSLDAKSADIMGELLSEMNKEAGITMILATHSEKLALKMSKTLNLGNGKLY